MRWTPGGSSDDIEDRRDDDSGGGGGFGVGGFGGMHLGIGGTLVLLVLSLIFGRNFFTLFSGGGAAPTERVADRPARTPSSDREAEFVKFVLNDVQSTWDRLLPAQTGSPYRHAKLVLFRDATDSGCGTAQTAIGPFYCPVDEKVYLDLGFFDELSEKFGAPGEFAQAYVIAHEIGHHVQKILGIEGKVRRLQRSEPEERNPLSVRLELQADCLAGVWGKSAGHEKAPDGGTVVDMSDIPAGLQAAAAVGDDRLQRMGSGHVSPESFTHGSSAQRTQWFRTGLDQGTVNACNTFQASGASEP
jgi:predicted metalloprotease